MHASLYIKYSTDGQTSMVVELKECPKISKQEQYWLNFWIGDGKLIKLSWEDRARRRRCSDGWRLTICKRCHRDVEECEHELLKEE